MADHTDISGKTTLITGGAGFIGSHLAGALLERGERVVVLDNFNDYYSPALKRANVRLYLDNPAFTLVEGDVRDRDLVMGLFDAYHPARVAHLAALAGVRYSIERAALYTAVNVQGTINLLDGAREHDVENFVFASTSSIYGATDAIPFTEDQPTDRPLAPYPATKKACEVMAHAYHNMFGLNVTALRFFTVYGPRVRPDMMAFVVMDRIVRDEEIVLFDGGEMHRDWTYVEDIVQGVVLALDKPLGYEVMNLGRGEPVRLGDFVAIIEKLVGKPARIRSVPAPASEPPITYASAEKARRLLGYQPTTSIEEGLARTWEWYQAVMLEP
jgi:UDP-glucuronate 4-epimerase